MKSLGMLSQRLERAERELVPALREAERQTMEQALQEADRLSQGPFSATQLRAMGHPYARRAPSPPQDPAIINEQSGTFRRSWGPILQHYAAGTLFTSVQNTAPYSGYLARGTSLMISRPLPQRVYERIRADRARRIRRVLRRYLPRRGYLSRPG